MPAGRLQRAAEGARPAARRPDDDERVGPGRHRRRASGPAARPRPRPATCAARSVSARPGSASASSRCRSPRSRTCSAGTTKLTGTARAVDGSRMEYLGPTGWRAVATPKPAGDGSFSVAVRPTATRAVPAQRSARPEPARSAWASRPRSGCSRSRTPLELRGTMRPAIIGAAVEIQRQIRNEPGARSAGRRSPKPAPSRAAINVPPGRYRARIARPGRGLVAGTSSDSGRGGMRRLLAVAVLALALPGAADAARFAVGDRARRGPSSGGAGRRGRAQAGRSSRWLPSRSRSRRPASEGSRELPGVAYVERLGARGRALSFLPTDPMATRQWHLNAVAGVRRLARSARRFPRCASP